MSGAESCAGLSVKERKQASTIKQLLLQRVAYVCVDTVPWDKAFQNPPVICSLSVVDVAYQAALLNSHTGKTSTVYF